jgi:glycine/D-amino acid oxidase-like deaminating enzyme
MVIKERKVEQKSKPQDLIIIGGGIMGLMTAYHASGFVKNITIIEKRVVGPANKEASSFSFTRSLHTDYLDPLYARLANEARNLWLELQEKIGRQLFVGCGCLNIAKEAVTPKLAETYTAKSYEVVERLNFRPEKFSKAGLRKRFPQFDADFGYLNTLGGLFYQREVFAALLEVLRERGVNILENTTTDGIDEQDADVRVSTDKGTLTTKKLVVTPGGKWANELLELVKGNDLRLPITLTRPQESRYYYPSRDKLAQFLPENFPVFAYLDVGIYGHPIYDKKRGAVKVAYYDPTDFESDTHGKITCVAEFVEECLPALRGVRSEDVTDADQCFYDLVSDDNFILGGLPGYRHILVGTGWRGAGYKFSPLVGKVLSQLALQNDTVYDINQFSPGRFAK